MQCRMLVGLSGAAGLLASTPWTANQKLMLLYSYGFLSSIFCMSISGSVGQLAAYLSDEYIGAVRVGEALPSIIVILCVIVSSYYGGDPDENNVVEFHMLTAVLTAAGGLTYFLLPMTSTIKLVFKIDDVDASEYHELDPRFWWVCTQVPLEIGGLLFSRAVYYTGLTITPFLSSDQPKGHLSQQIVIVSMFADVLGRLVTASPAVTKHFVGNKSVFQHLVLVDVLLSVFCILVVILVHGRVVRCLAYFVAISLNGSLYCVSNLRALHKVDNPYHKPKFMCVLDMAHATVCVASSSAILLIVLINQHIAKHIG